MTLQPYAADTPNNRRITIALEEMGSPTGHPCGLSGRGAVLLGREGHQPFRQDPALVDSGAGRDPPLTLFERGAILTDLADRSGRFPLTDPADRYTA